MNIFEYRDSVVRTMASDMDKETAQRIWLLGLMGESGEVSEIIKKHVAHGHELNRDALVKEFGDCLWYWVAACIDFGFEDLLPRLNESILSHSRSTGELVSASMDLIQMTGNFVCHASNVWHRRYLYPYSDWMYVSSAVDYYGYNWSAFVRFLQLDPSEIMEANIHKLKVRFPHHFNTEDSIARVDVE